MTALVETLWPDNFLADENGLEINLTASSGGADTYTAHSNQLLFALNSGSSTHTLSVTGGVHGPTGIATSITTEDIDGGELKVVHLPLLGWVDNTNVVTITASNAEVLLGVLEFPFPMGSLKSTIDPYASTLYNVSLEAGDTGSGNDLALQNSNLIICAGIAGTTGGLGIFTTPTLTDPITSRTGTKAITVASLEVWVQYLTRELTLDETITMTASAITASIGVIGW